MDHGYARAAEEYESRLFAGPEDEEESQKEYEAKMDYLDSIADEV